MKNFHIKIFLIVGLICITNNFYSQNSLSFDGVNDYVTVPNGGGLNSLQTGTIELWVKWNDINQDAGYTNSYGAIISRQQNNNFSNQIIALSQSNPNTAKIIWRPYGPSANVLVSSSSPMVNTWIHIAIVYSSGNHKMYINGVEESVSSSTGTIANNTSVPFSIGAWTGDGNCYSNSNIDEFRVWNITRTSSEISTNMNKELAGNESNLVTYFNFNQGTANGENSTETVLNDSASNNFDGTLTNFALTGTTSNWVLGLDFNSLSTGENKLTNSNFFIHKNLLIFKKSESTNEVKNIEIYNLLGQRVFKTTKIEREVSLSEMNSNLYILKVNFKNNAFETLTFIIN